MDFWKNLLNVDNPVIYLGLVSVMLIWKAPEILRIIIMAITKKPLNGNGNGNGKDDKPIIVQLDPNTCLQLAEIHNNTVFVKDQFDRNKSDNLTDVIKNNALQTQSLVNAIQTLVEEMKKTNTLLVENNAK